MALSNFGFCPTPVSVVTERSSLDQKLTTGGSLYHEMAYYEQTLQGLAGQGVTYVARELEGVQTFQPGAIIVHDRFSVGRQHTTGSSFYQEEQYYQLEGVWTHQSQFAFGLPELPPNAVSLAPSSGSVVGGTVFTLTGTGFQAGATVRFGSTLATGVVVTATQITGIVPAGVSLGAVVVTVTNPDLQTDTLVYTYIAGPAFLEMSPDLGFPSLDDHFDTTRNALLVQVEEDELTPVSGGDSTPGTKGLGNFRVVISGVTYEVPLAFRRRLRTRNGGRVVWRSTEGDRGVFRFFHLSPPVFEETELVRI
jgi:hypothetical protein